MPVPQGSSTPVGAAVGAIVGEGVGAAVGAVVGALGSGTAGRQRPHNAGQSTARD